MLGKRENTQSFFKFTQRRLAVGTDVLVKPFQPPLPRFGASAEEKVSGILDAIASGDTTALDDEIRQAAQAGVDDVENAGPGFNSIARGKAGPDGHQLKTIGRLPKVLSLEQSLALMKKAIGPAKFFGSFPNPAVAVIPPEMNSNFEQAKSKSEWLKDNAAAIREYSDKAINKGGVDLKGHYGMLGPASIVKIMHTAELEWGDKRAVYFVAATTSLHPKDGINIWTIIRDKYGNLYCMNDLLGVHIFLLPELGNNVFGEPLMATARQTLVYSVKAEEAGMRVLEYLRDFQPDLFRSHQTWATLDWVFGIPLAYMRKLVGGNTAVDLSKTYEVILKDPSQVSESTLTDVLDGVAGALRETKDLPGVFYDGIPIVAQSLITFQDYTTAGDHIMNPITKKQRETATEIVTNTARYTQSQEDIDNLKAGILNVLSYFLPQEVDISNLETAETIYERIQVDPDFGPMIRQQIRDKILDPTTMADIKDKIRLHPDFADLKKQNPLDDFSKCIEQIANDHVNAHVIFEMSKPGGLIQQWALEGIDDHLRTKVAPLDLDAAVADVMQRLQDQQKFVDQARQSRQEMADSDPRVQEADREVRKAEDELREAEQTKDGATDMQDLQQNSDERQDRRQQEEEQERESMFSPPAEEPREVR